MVASQKQRFIIADYASRYWMFWKYSRSLIQ